MNTNNETSQEPIKSVDNRNPDGTFGPNNNANPNGRPKGKTLKEFARDFLMSMSDDKKREFLNSLNKDVVWRMAEGNPHQTTDVTSKDKPIAIYGGLSKYNSHEKDIQPEEENQGS